MTNIADPVAVNRAVASLARVALRHDAAPDAQSQHVLRLSYRALGTVLDVRTPNEGLGTPNHLLDLTESRLADVLPTLTQEQLVGAYHLANLLPAGLETLWEQIDEHMASLGMSRPERHPAMNTADTTPRGGS